MTTPFTRYRSLETIEAVQYTGDTIPGVTCSGSDAEVQEHGCDSSRKRHTHVHTTATGGMTVLKESDWVFPMPGGPFGTASDAKFRSHWEVPVIDSVVDPVADDATCYSLLSPPMEPLPASVQDHHEDGHNDHGAAEDHGAEQNATIHEDEHHEEHGN